MHPSWMVRFCLLASLAVPNVASALKVIVPDQSLTINGAMQMISYCDTVLVRSGTYVEEVTGSYCFTLLSESGPESTVIVGGIWPPHFEAGPQITIDGFTIRDGMGISISGGAPMALVNIRNCVIENNSKLGRPGLIPYGGGIYLACTGNIIAFGNPRIRIEDCIIRNNQGRFGGGVWIRQEALIEDCVIIDNVATMEGGGIYYDPNNAPRIVQRSTIASNQSAGGGAGIHCLANSGLRFKVWNTIVALNDGGYGIFTDAPSDSIRCTNAWANSAGNYQGLPDPTGTAGNLNVDPLFCAPELGDYRLQVDSPCANAPGCGLIGGLGTGCAVTAIGEEAVPGLAALQLSPNPSTTSITVELGSGAGDHAVLLVHDVLGRQVARIGPQARSPRATWTWPIPGAERPAAGVYYFLVEDRGARVASGRGVLLAP